MSAQGQGEGIESLIDAVIDGRCGEADRRRFETLVRDDPWIRRAYLDQMHMHALLEWRHGQVESAVGRPRMELVRSLLRRPRRWGLAAILLIGVGLVALAPRSWRPRSGAEAIGTLLEARNVVWARGAAPLAVSQRFGPGWIHTVSGTLRLAFDSGAQVTLKGPADLQVLSGMRLRAARGRITARVEGGAKGFAVETHNTLVVDQGTEFGVEVDGLGRTGVVVFEGLVDLLSMAAAEDPQAVTRLGQGEGLRVDQSGERSRIVAIERRLGDDAWSTEPSTAREAVIRSVHDNIRGLGSSKYYQIVPGGFDEDVQAYVDRPHQWNGRFPSGLPPVLLGADYIMPFNDDKWLDNLEITVELARPATLYVFLDRREEPPPWLTAGFTDTGLSIGLDEGEWPQPSPASFGRGPGKSINQVFFVWKREIEAAGPVALGSLTGGKNNRAMYGIAAVARRALAER